MKKDTRKVEPGELKNDTLDKDSDYNCSSSSSSIYNIPNWYDEEDSKMNKIYMGKKLIVKLWNIEVYWLYELKPRFKYNIPKNIRGRK